MKFLVNARERRLSFILLVVLGTTKVCKIKVTTIYICVVVVGVVAGAVVVVAVVVVVVVVVVVGVVWGYRSRSLLITVL